MTTIRDYLDSIRRSLTEIEECYVGRLDDKPKQIVATSLAISDDVVRLSQQIVRTEELDTVKATWE